MSAMCQERPWRRLFDHLISACEHGWRHGEAEGLRSFEIDHQLIFGRSLHGQICRLLALENAIVVLGRTPVLIDPIGP